MYTFSRHKIEVGNMFKNDFITHITIYLFGPPRQIICDEVTEFSSAIIQAILCMLNCRLKVTSPYNHGSSKCERQI